MHANLKAKSYDFTPRLFLREMDENIVARGKLTTYKEKTREGTWTVHQSELRYRPTHDEYILEISHYGDADRPRAFSLFVHRLPNDNLWGK